MDRKTFQEQLKDAASSLGLRAKDQQEEKTTKERKPRVLSEKSQTSSDKAANSTGGSAPKRTLFSNKAPSKVTEPIPNIMQCVDKWAISRETRKISVADEFFNLADLASRFPKHCRTWRFMRSLCRAAARTSLAIENAPAILKKEDILSFERSFSEIRAFIAENDFEHARKELAYECDREFRLIQAEYTRSRWETLYKVADKIFNLHVRCSFPQPFLDEQDIKLAIQWWDRNLPQLPSRESLITEVGKDWKFGRSLSARSAEKAAIEFYRAYGFEVEDISIQQIGQNECPDWMDYDLNVGGYPVDVKNSRRSQHSPNSYTEHCVPAFKHNRNKQQVRVCGVLSPYLWADELLDPLAKQRYPLLILGETTLTDQVALKSEFEEAELLQIDLRRPSEDTKFFLPPWMFSYPKWAYTNRDDLLREARRIAIPDAQICRSAGLNPIPLCIAAGVELRRYWKEVDLSPWEWEFFRDLSSRVGRHGLSLPILFLSVLKHFLRMATRPPGDTDGYSPSNYKKFAFYKDQLGVPLGIYDPLETLSILVDCLNTLWAAERERIRSYKVFRLQGFNILLAKSHRDRDQWKTLIAYCGGRSPVNNAACGKNPLVLGQCKHCHVCGKLICPECDFCSKGCKRGNQLRFFDFPAGHLQI